MAFGEKKSFFTRLKEGLTKTKDEMVSKIEDVIFQRPAIDEDMLREAVGGQSSEGSMLEVAERQSAGSEEQSELPSGRKRRMTLPDYEATFLKPVRIKVRSALYVSEETRCKISEVARKIGAGRVSVIGYVENILPCHKH